ncbi:hypothetical protein CHH62_13130 [Niallia circulans]|nr:hypothetical protein CHH62_13130 [Niallia circulans]
MITNYKRIIEPNVTVRKQIRKITNKRIKKWLIVGQALRLERKRLGLTLNQIGKILGTSPSRISNLENGNGVMLANHLIASYKLVLDMKN